MRCFLQCCFASATCLAIGAAAFAAERGADFKGRDVKGKGVKEKVRAGTRWTYMEIPNLTEAERFNLALKARREGAAYRNRATAKAERLSSELEAHIRKWLAGKADANIPKGLLPRYIDSAKTHDWKLVRPEDVKPEDQWFSMPMYDPSKELFQNSPDPHATYFKLIFIAPFGSKLLVEGDFPRCRFMDYQILQPFDPSFPVTGNMGVCEVPLVDVDIEPDPGHVNPFRVGADRSATKRHYHVTFELKAGNAVELNPEVMRAPAYRDSGNTRVGGPFGFAGPWGDGVLVPSVLWLRCYAPDKDAGKFGGVAWPKAVLQLSTGEKFWLTCDKSKAVKDQTMPVHVQPTAPAEPYVFDGPILGWFKMFGMILVRGEAHAYHRMAKPFGPMDPDEVKWKMRGILRLQWNRGQDAPPPGCFECSATCCNYISYLLRPMVLGQDKVLVVTGRLPEYPKTRDGERKMTGGQIRYFSITHQRGGGGARGGSIHTGTPLGSLMDDEIVLNKRREYVIVYTRGSERPKNAVKANGVTWQEWGPISRQSVVLRWLSVLPEWHLPKFAPHEDNITWEKGSWSSKQFDKSLVGRNRPGTMGPYHPVIHYMSRAEFEALGNRIDPRRVPEWK